MIRRKNKGRNDVKEGRRISIRGGECKNVGGGGGGGGSINNG